MRHGDPWRYYAEPLNVIDGDTIELAVDMGFHTVRRERLRLNRVDTAELPPELHLPSTDRSDLSEERREEYSDALDHLDFVEAWILEAVERHDPPLLVKTHQKRGSFGRYLADVHRATPDGTDVEALPLNDALLEEFGNSVQY